MKLPYPSWTLTHAIMMMGFCATATLTACDGSSEDTSGTGASTSTGGGGSGGQSSGGGGTGGASSGGGGNGGANSGGGGMNSGGGGGNGGNGGASTPAELCAKTGGTETTWSCCPGTNDYPSTCGIGPCSCAPDLSVDTKACNCPSGECYSPIEGCIPMNEL